MFGHDAIDAYEANLMSMWDFEPQGNLKDKIGTNNGTNYGTTDAVGHHGRGRLLVAASTQHIDYGNGGRLAPTSGLTLVILAKLTANVSANQALLGKHDSDNKRSYLLMAQATNGLRGIVSSDGSNAVGKRSITTTANGIIVPGTWQLLIMDFSITDKNIGIYVNDTDVGSVDENAAAGIATFADVNFAHGATHASGVATNFLNATVDEIAVYNTRISAAARTAFYNGGNFRYWMPDLSPDAVRMPSMTFNRQGRGNRRRR